MNQIEPITLDQLKELRKFQELSQKYLAQDEVLKLKAEEAEFERRSFRYYFRHPYLRLLTACTVTILNFYIFAEDPISHSVTDCKVDVIGNIYSFVFLKYPENGFAALKVILWLAAVKFGLIFGKLVIHKWLLCSKFKAKLFTKEGQGSWMTIFLTTILSLFMFSLIYDACLDAAGSDMARYKSDNNLHVTNQGFMKVAAICTWLGDFITAWMVTDMMLQEKKYVNWMKRLRRFWCKGQNRVIIFWFTALGMTAVVITGITTNFLDWDEMNKHFFATNEFSRACLASSILCFDLLIVMQDWEFPHFAGGTEIKLPGVGTGDIGFTLPSCCGKSKEGIEINISGKWFNYGILFIVMILDLNMWKSQIYYSPHDFGQYTDSEGHIYTVTDKVFINNANETTLSYDWRWSHVIPGTNGTLYGSRDQVTTAKFKGYSMRLKALAFVPSMFAFCLFFYFIYQYGKEENPEEKMVRKWKEGRFKIRKKKIAPKEISTGIDLKQTIPLTDGEMFLDPPFQYSITAVGMAEPRTTVNGTVRRTEGTDLGYTIAIADTDLNNTVIDDTINPQEAINMNGFSDTTATATTTPAPRATPTPTPTDMRSINPSQMHPKNDFQYYFKHPNSRLLIAYFSVFLSWLMFAQDPIAYSSADCKVDVLGHAYSFIFTKYPNNGFAALKVIFWISAIISGVILGKIFIHKILFCNILRFKIFTSDGQGSWVIMFLTSIVFIFLWTFMYNETLKATGNQKYVVSSNMQIKYETFMKGAMATVWFGHFLTAWMVTDVMLQQRRYRCWVKDLRYFWRNSKLRIIVFWLITTITAVVSIIAVCLDFLKWDSMNKNLPSSNEVSRSFLASFIIVCDLVIIMQDWQFPNFSSTTKFKLPGTNKRNLSFKLIRSQVKITGNWICYGLIAVVMVIDVWNWMNQLFYSPFKYGQYVVKETKRIYSVTDRSFTQNANETMMSYEYRINHFGKDSRSFFESDFRTNTKYFGDSLAEKSAAFIPALITFTWFVISAMKAKKIQQNAS